MASDQVIQIDMLRKAINGILDFIEKDLAASEVNLTKDHYWTVLDSDLYETERPEELGAGSLHDDWEFLLACANDKEQQLPIMLIHVAPLLKALSTAAQSYKPPAAKRSD